MLDLRFGMEWSGEELSKCVCGLGKRFCVGRMRGVVSD